jgi:hypothetical protein
VSPYEPRSLSYLARVRTFRSDSCAIDSLVHAALTAEHHCPPAEARGGELACILHYLRDFPVIGQSQRPNRTRMVAWKTLTHSANVDGLRMSKLNVEPIITFADGSQLLVSTQYSGAGSFTCELYLSLPCTKDRLDLTAVSDQLEAPTCREAQDIAFRYASRQYPEKASGMKGPPYLIWPRPHLPVGPDNRWRRSVQR